MRRPCAPRSLFSLCFRQKHIVSHPEVWEFFNVWPCCRPRLDQPCISINDRSRFFNTSSGLDVTVYTYLYPWVVRYNHEMLRFVELSLACTHVSLRPTSCPQKTSGRQELPSRVRALLHHLPGRPYPLWSNACLLERGLGEAGRSPDSTVRAARFFLRSWQNKVSRLHYTRRKRCSCPSLRAAKATSATRSPLCGCLADTRGSGARHAAQRRGSPPKRPTAGRKRADGSTRGAFRVRRPSGFPSLRTHSPVKGFGGDV